MRAHLQAARMLRVAGANRPNPTLFYYPGLTSRPWYEREAHPFREWVHDLEAAVPDITQEYLTMRGAGKPSDYAPDATDHDGQLHTGGEWHWGSLIDRGRRRQEMWNQCPKTATAVSAVPNLCEGDMPFAFTFFSTLQPGARIKPHFSPCNLRVRVHLPLLVPNDVDTCGIRVGTETRRWEPGKCLIFDDAYEHEVWNTGSTPRVILLLDLWHWELTSGEISAIEAMFRKVESLRDGRNAASQSPQVGRVS